MEILKIAELAEFEKVPPPRLENSNFEWSFKMLSKDRRIAMSSLYNLLSYLDNLVDEQLGTNNPAAIRNFQNKKIERINFWDKTIDSIYEENYEVPECLKNLKYIISRFNIPKQYFQQLINGFRRDLTQNRYETFEELKSYAFEVASVVGLISIEIFGYKYESARNYAINLGYALQLTNIIRDIKADKDRGYIYLPLEDLRKFNYSVEELQNEVYNDKFVELLDFEAQRAKDYYFKARSFLRPEERRSMIAASIMDEIYFRLLEKIQLREYNIFLKKIKVTRTHKIIIALKHYIGLKLFVNRLKKLP